MKTTDVTIKNPCNEDWDAMSGGRKRRHCASCDKDVFHLSQMTQEEAQKLLRERDASICVRYAHDETGSILFRDSTLGGRLELQWEGVRKLVAAAALVVPGLALVACDAATTMGDVAPADPNYAGAHHRPSAPEPRPVTVTIIDGEAPRVSVRPAPIATPRTPRPRLEPRTPVVTPIEKRMGRIARPREIMGDVAME